MLRRCLPLCVLLLSLLPLAARRPLHAASPDAASLGVTDQFFTTSDGVRLHMLEAAPGGNPHIIVFVPGWTMPAWIWAPQIAAFSGKYRVIAFDPRGQGDSDIPATGYNQDRRGADIADLLADLASRFGPQPVLLVGWSLGVLDSLAYMHSNGDGRLAGLVLVDNSVGENPPPPPNTRMMPRIVPRRRRPVVPYDLRMRRFVAGMFRQQQDAAYLDRLTAAALRLPQQDAAQLLAYPVPRSYWKNAIYATTRPVLYIVRPGLAGQAANLAAHHQDAQAVIFSDAGHALFVDDAARFNATLAAFIGQRVWP